MKNYIVVGAGVSGCTAAYTLANQGVGVTIVERESVAGGKVLEYCCKATDSCSRCGVCVAHTQVYDTLAHPNVRLLTGAEVTKLAESREKTVVHILQKNPAIDYSLCEFCGDCMAACPEQCISRYQRGELVQYVIDYSRCRLHKGEACDLCVKACSAGAITADGAERKTTVSGEAMLLTTGHAPFKAERKPRYGYSRSDKIITGAEAEAFLSENTDLVGARDIAFIQCVGSRDPVIGRNYCSAVCCSYALRLARILKYRNPEVRVTIYYIDIQNFDKEYNLLRKEIEDLGVVFKRGLPFRVDELANGKLRCMVENMDGEESLVEHDLVVLSVGMGPDERAADTAEIFGIQQDEFGFYVPGGGQVYTTGTCREPQSIPESMAAAKSAAAEMTEDRNG